MLRRSADQREFGRILSLSSEDGSVDGYGSSKSGFAKRAMFKEPTPVF